MSAPVPIVAAADLAEIVRQAQEKGIPSKALEPCAWCGPRGGNTTCTCTASCGWYECLHGMRALPLPGEFHALYPIPKFEA